jgi:hypothetical protein
MDFLHYITRINCLTGAITSETHITNKYIYITKYDPPQLFCLVWLPTDKFKNMLSREELTEEQVNLCRDIRYFILKGELHEN